MSNAAVVAAIAKLVEQACAARTNAFGYGIWTHHLTSVVQFGRELAAVTGAEGEIVELAALLHDYAGIRDVRLEPDHHLHGAALAGDLLSALGYPAEQTERVAACILTHRASQNLEPQLKPQSLEARVVASADAAAHILQVPSLLYLAYVRKGLGIDEGAAWVRGKLERSYQKLMPEAKTLIEGRYRGALELLSLSAEGAEARAAGRY